MKFEVRVATKTPEHWYFSHQREALTILPLRQYFKVHESYHIRSGKTDALITTFNLKNDCMETTHMLGGLLIFVCGQVQSRIKKVVVEFGRKYAPPIQSRPVLPTPTLVQSTPDHINGGTSNFVDPTCDNGTHDTTVKQNRRVPQWTQDKINFLIKTMEKVRVLIRRGEIMPNRYMKQAYIMMKKRFRNITRTSIRLKWRSLIHSDHVQPVVSDVDLDLVNTAPPAPTLDLATKRKWSETESNVFLDVVSGESGLLTRVPVPKKKWSHASSLCQSRGVCRSVNACRLFWENYVRDIFTSTVSLLSREKKYRMVLNECMRTLQCPANSGYYMPCEPGEKVPKCLRGILWGIL